MSFLKKIELRQAVPDDLKVLVRGQYRLKIGQPYCIGEEDSDDIKGIYVLDGTEDSFVIGLYLKKGLVFIPINEYSLSNYLKLEKEDDVHGN